MCELHSFLDRELEKRYPGAVFQYPILDNESLRLLDWPRRLDGRGWPQRCGFSPASLHEVVLVVAVEIMELSVKNLSVLVAFNPHREFWDSARVLGICEEEFEMISPVMTKSNQPRFQAVASVDKSINKAGKTPSFSVSEIPSPGTCFRLTTFQGNFSMVKLRLWFRQSPTGQFCALPSEWHGPSRAHWTSLIIVDVWQELVVAALYVGGQCFFPNKPVREWKVSDEDMRQERHGEYDHANSAVFSPDGCLVSVWQSGWNSTIWILDLQERCKHPFSQQLPKPSVYVGSTERPLSFAGSVAFDPGSFVQNGRASRIAYTSKVGEGRGRPEARFAYDHTVSVCDLNTGELSWSYHHSHCLDDLQYCRYGKFLAVTALKTISAALDNWEVLLLNPLHGNVLRRVEVPRGMFQVYFSPLGTSLLLHNFTAAAQSSELLPTVVSTDVAVPTLSELARFAIHKRVFCQSDVQQLPLPPALQQYLRYSLPLSLP